MIRALQSIDPRRPLALAALCILGWLVFMKFTAAHPWIAWLSIRVLAAWVLAAVFSVSCLAAGATVLRWLTKGARRDGHWALSFTLGVLLFAEAIALLGHLHLLLQPVIWLLPIAMLLFGRDAFFETVLEGWQKKRLPFERYELVWLGLGVVGLFVALLPIANPENINFDARWYHLPLAERYAAMGAITRSVEGNALVAGPQLASWLYTWPFLDTAASSFDKVMRANHLEAACFLFTLAGIPATARALSPTMDQKASRWAWVALMLFPSLYIYDTGLMGGADHVAALFVPPILLAWFQAQERNDVRSWVLLGLFIGGLALTKYTAIILLLPLALAVAVERLTRIKSLGAGPALRFPLICLAVALAASSPYWLRNWIWYGDPVYPVAPSVFHPKPWATDAATWSVRYGADFFVPTEGTLGGRLLETLKSLWNYHLSLYTWEDFVANTPVFGSLYAISLGVLPFLKRTRRVWAVAAIVHLGIAVWFNLAHQMRYLIPFVPAMAASAAVVFHQAWSWKSLAVRVGLVGAIALQLICAADVAFLPTHRMNGRIAPIVYAANLFGRGMENNLDRFKAFPVWTSFGQKVPPQAVVLLHGTWPTIGFGHPTVTDSPGIQYGLSYRELGSPEAIRAKLAKMGITHVGWADASSELNSVSDELLFRAFTRLSLGNPVPDREWLFAPLASASKPVPEGDVLYLGCGGSYASGLFDLGALKLPHLAKAAAATQLPPPKETSETPLELTKKAAFIVSEDGCSHPATFTGFKTLGKNTADNLTLSFFMKGP